MNSIEYNGQKWRAVKLRQLESGLTQQEAGKRTAFNLRLVADALDAGEVFIMKTGFQRVEDNPAAQINPSNNLSGVETFGFMFEIAWNK